MGGTLSLAIEHSVDPTTKRDLQLTTTNNHVVVVKDSQLLKGLLHFLQDLHYRELPPIIWVFLASLSFWCCAAGIESNPVLSFARPRIGRT